MERKVGENLFCPDATRHAHPVFGWPPRTGPEIPELRCDVSRCAFAANRAVTGHLCCEILRRIACSLRKGCAELQRTYYGVASAARVGRGARR